MTNILSFLLFLALILQVHTSWAQQKRVASLESKDFEQTAEQHTKPTLKLTKKERKEFDQKGRLLRHELFLSNPAGELILRTSRSTAWNNEFRMEELAKFDEMGDNMSNYKTSYNIINNRIAKIEFSEFVRDAGKIFTKTYKYNRIGKPARIVLNNDRGKRIGEERFKYNKLHEETYHRKWEIKTDKSKYTKTKKTAYTKEGYLASSESNIKENGDVLKDIITFHRNKIKEHLKYKNGEQISSFGGARASYDPSKARVLIDFGNRRGGIGLWHNEDEYDENDHKVKTTQMIDDEVTEIILYKYDPESNLTEKTHTSYDKGKDIGTTKEVYQYDSKNSILKKSIYKDGNIVSEHVNNYKYY